MDTHIDGPAKKRYDKTSAFRWSGRFNLRQIEFFRLQSSPFDFRFLFPFIIKIISLSCKHRFLQDIFKK